MRSAIKSWSGRTIVVALAIEVLVYVGFLVNSLTVDAALPGASSIDTVANVRVVILVLIFTQVITVLIIRKYVVTVFGSVLVVVAYLYWWIITSQAVSSMETPNYGSVDHLLYLEGANIADFLVLLCSLAILSVSLAVFRYRS
jgi:hypothetical protein